MSHIETLFYEILIPYDGMKGAMLRWPINVDPVGYAAHWEKNYNSSRQKFVNAIRYIGRKIAPSWWI